MILKQDIKYISSVGVDIGTSTSHLVFSKLVLKKDPKSRTEKYHVAERNITYRGDIFLTPFKNNNTEIDIEELTDILLQEYSKANINVTDIDTGAVIITGESAKKENAEIIVERISQGSGKFVAASAGPNFESIISAHGSGAVKYSREHNKKLIHSDIGGGTANIAFIDNGTIRATSCINIGGRLIAFDSDDVITRLETPAEWVMKHNNFSLNIGNKITTEQKEMLAETLAQCLVELLTGQTLSELTHKLMMTQTLPENIFTEELELSFSGGVAEYIYNRTKEEFGDIGKLLGHKINQKLSKHGIPVVEAAEKIRATVIGASEYTLQVSGNTSYISVKKVDSLLPLRNLPIIVPQIDRNNLTIESVAKSVQTALQRLDFEEGTEPLALAFHDPVRSVYDKLTLFSKGIVKALPNTIKNNVPIILIFDTDIGNSVGNVLKRETKINNEVLSIDEIPLDEGSFVDIGRPIVGRQVFPVIIKSLVFS
ncbi:MAG: ethanolamine ammonia-lyase reactivating factor EutA [Candidatus Hodarchaeales archaeon]